MRQICIFSMCGLVRHRLLGYLIVSIGDRGIYRSKQAMVQMPTAEEFEALQKALADAKANGVEPYRYLVALFKKLPLAQTAEDYEELLPWNIDLSRS